MLLKKEHHRQEQQDEILKPGLVCDNFMKIAPSGFGDPYNAYPHSMAWFKDSLYVGTTRANLANRAKQVQANTPERLGEIFPVKIPRNYFDNDLRAEIWRYHISTNTWERVYVSPLVQGVDGYDVPISVGFRSMTSFQAPGESSPSLYVPTWGSHQTPGTLMLRTVDGSGFEVVSAPGLGITENAPRSLRGIISFRDRLFTSPVVGQKRLQPNVAGSAIVYTSSNPLGGEWVCACEPYFGNRNNISVFHMAEYNGYLYAGTMNIHEGFEVWKTDAEGAPPYQWKKVLACGAYRGKLNQIAMTLISFRGHLYVGSAIQNCSFDFDNNIGPAAPEMIRINPDDSWDIVFGEPRMTPDGFKVPLSGLGSGLGNPFSGYIWSMCVHEGWLYVGNAVWTVFLRYAGRSDRWPKSLGHIFEPDNVERILQRYGGCDLWRTRDGLHWVPVTQNGFDNCFNIGFRNMVSSPYGLFVGAANPFAPEVAVKRVAGWNYEVNHRGALEIWMGTGAAGLSDSLRDSDMPGESSSNIPMFTNEDSEDNGHLERELQDFFGRSGFCHFGYWRVDITDAKSSCENLMDEILAFVPEKKGTVIDVGCGMGASTRYLLKYFPTDCVTGITTKPGNVSICDRMAPGAKFIYRELPSLDLPYESVDVVIWAENFVEDLGSRQKLLRECFKVLKPGGQLVCFDSLSPAIETGGIFRNRLKGRKSVTSIDNYSKLLSVSGFANIRLFDVTSASLISFEKHAKKYFGLRRLSDQIDDEMYLNIESSLMLDQSRIIPCVLVSAYKPDCTADKS